MNKKMLGQIGEMDLCHAFIVVYGWVLAELVGIESKMIGKVDVFHCNDLLCQLEEVLIAIERKLLLKKLLPIVRLRFSNHMYRHGDIKWEQIELILNNAAIEKLESLKWMETTGGEPDVIILKGNLAFVDMAEESPSGRRNCVYDAVGEKNLYEKDPSSKCNGNAVDLAKAAGVKILDEEEYRAIQQLDELDNKTWSWILTPDHIRRNNKALTGCHGHDIKIVSFVPGFCLGNGAFRALLWLL